MSQPKITLYSDSHFFSPYVMSVYVALKEKGVRFELEPVDLAESENQQEAYAELSLTRRVPTLLHENFSLSESSAITEYLDEVFAAPDFASLYPIDTQKELRRVKSKRGCAAI